MAILCNEWIRFELDDRARVTRLENLQTGKGNVITDPKPVFRVNLHTGSNLEDMAFGEDQACEVIQGEDEIRVRVRSLKARCGEADVALELRMTLDRDHIRFGATVTNHSTSTVAELFYPLLGTMKTLDGMPMDLLFPDGAGKRFTDIEKTLMNIEGRESLHEIRSTYPWPLSMCWMALVGGRQCLYFASYDPLMYVSFLRVKGSSQGGVSLELNKACFVKNGETWQAPEAVARLYEGSWREGADEYAAFAATWRHPVKPQEWMRKMNGYFLVIHKQQYGDEFWPYDTLPELYGYAQAHGCDTIGMFGWYHSGHDNNYPDLDVSPTLGGEEGLKKGIRAVQDMGGRVTLYYQGHLIDLNSPFYRKIGPEVESRTIFNNPYLEFYPKAFSSDFARHFSRRVFAAACPSCTPWQDLMAERIDWLAGFGADGALYDQIGGCYPYPCFNESHPHMLGKPSLSHSQGGIRLHNRIQEKVKQHPNFAFMSELITDTFSQFLDCVHGWGYATAPTARNARHECAMPELFRYTFPQTLMTARNSKPYMDERLVNYAFVYGFKLEMEVRYLGDQQDIRSDAEPEKRLYAKAVSDLRREFEDYLLLGIFRADEGIACYTPGLVATVFRAEDGRKALALWNDNDDERTVRVDLQDMQALRYATLRARGEGMPERLGANEIAIVELRDV